MKTGRYTFLNPQILSGFSTSMKGTIVVFDLDGPGANYFAGVWRKHVQIRGGEVTLEPTSKRTLSAANGIQKLYVFGTVEDKTHPQEKLDPQQRETLHLGFISLTPNDFLNYIFQVELQHGYFKALCQKPPGLLPLPYNVLISRVISAQPETLAVQKYRTASITPLTRCSVFQDEYLDTSWLAVCLAPHVASPTVGPRNNPMHDFPYINWGPGGAQRLHANRTKHHMTDRLAYSGRNKRRRVAIASAA